MLRRAASGPIKTFSLGFDEPTDEPTTPGSWRRPSRPSTTSGAARAGPRPTSPTRSGTPKSRRSTRCSCTCCTASSASTSSVVLSGLGGDELFAGYDFYGYLHAHASCAAARLGGAGVRALAPALDWTARRAAGTGPARSSTWPPASSNGWPPPAIRRATTCCCATRGTSTRRCCAACTRPSSPTGSRAPTRDDFDALLRRRRGRSSRQALRAEFATKMVCDLLHNEDTMSMAHSVESRVPAARPRAGPVRRAHSRRHPLRRRSQGAAQGRAARGAAGPGARTRRSGDSPSILSSSTRRTWDRWPASC